MVNFLEKDKYGFYDLVEITKLLRSPDGCPWDREQSHKSIRMNFVEEVFEACEAIDNDDPVLLLEELGDVLAQVVFHAELESEAGRFNVDDVADGVCKKFIARHPHVFGEVSAKTSDEVLKNWDDIKRREKKQESHTSAMNSVARSLPSLMRAEKLLGKAKKAGLPEKSIEELSMAVSGELSRGEDMDIAEVLMNVVKIARVLGVNPEQALDLKNERFIETFGELEACGRDMKEVLAENADKL